LKRVVQFIILAGVLTLGFWFFRMLFPNDADVVRKRLATMAAEASFDTNEGAFTKISKAGKLAACFTVDAEINVKPWGRHEVVVNGRTEIRQAAVGARSAVEALKITVEGTEVTIADDRETARVFLSLIARSSFQEEPWTGGMEVQMRRVEGDWLISRVANRQFIRQ